MGKTERERVCVSACVCVCVCVSSPVSTHKRVNLSARATTSNANPQLPLTPAMSPSMCTDAVHVCESSADRGGGGGGSCAGRGGGGLNPSYS